MGPVLLSMMLWCRYKIAFVMPSKYKSSAELHKPKNAQVTLKDMPSHTFAAISWR